MSDQDHFFSIQHDFHVSAVPMAPTATLPSTDQLEQMIPLPFKLASEISQLDASALRPLRNLGDVAHDLVDFLNLQSKKIDMIMSYIMTLEDERQQRSIGTSFGGSHLSFLSNQPLVPDSLVELKIYITDENCAVFCIARISDCQPLADQYQINTEFELIREEDQEQLVRASLRVQSRKLKERAEQRQDNP